MPARLILADDHQLMRDGLRALIESGALGELEIVAEAGNIQDTKRAVATYQPDLAIIDLKMPGGSAIELVRDLVVTQPRLKVLVLTSYEEVAFLRAALAAGASGYVLKRSAHSHLADAVKTLLAGGIFVDHSLRMDGSTPNVPGVLAAEKLTPREREVLVLLARGLTYKEVGARLQIGARTVETHRRKLGEKLALHTRADVLRFALEFGLVKPGDVDSSEPQAEL